MEGTICLKLAEHQSARIIFSGDTKQIRSVEASDALRVLEKESGLKSISLNQVQRQTTRSYREAIQELRHDPERGLNKLETMGAVREVPWLDRAQALQQAYAEAQSQLNAKGQQRNLLIVAATHGAPGQAVRARLVFVDKLVCRSGKTTGTVTIRPSLKFLVRWGC